jgi:DNA-binding NarL/FixJ family response regulator
MRLGILAGWPIFGLGLRAACESQPDLTVDWLTGSASETFLLAAHNPPDAMLIDADVDGAFGLVQGLLAQAPASLVVTLTASLDETRSQEAEHAGARAFLAKSVPPLALAQQLRNLNGPTPGPAAASSLDGWRSGLSQREVEVLVGIRGGWTSDEIARRLGISSSTVNKHVNGILRKLGARSRAQAAGLLDHVLNVSGEG